MYWLLLLLSSIAAIGRVIAQPGLPVEPRLSAHGWIVEIEGNYDLETIKASATRIVSRFPGIDELFIPHEYTSNIFYGFSFHCKFMKEIALSTNIKKTLSNIRGVNHVWDSLTYHERSIDSHEFVPDSFTQPALSEDAKSRINSIHNLTQVMDLQLMSLSGEGVTVAVIDGGLDYLHPALGGGYGQGFKVQYGYDFVGDNVRPPNVEAPDNDPYGDCSNHATHTAGILFGDDISIGYRGVAPGISVEHYRVFDCNGMSTSDVVLQAVLMAVERKVDLINLSLGSGSRPFSDDPLASLISRINRQRRTFIVVAAGNNGRNGTWSAASPEGGGPDIYTAGSFDLDYSYSILRPGQAVTSGNNSKMIELTWNPPSWTAWFNNFIPESIGLVALSENQDVSQDGCQEITPNSSLYQDKIVLIRRGGCSLTNKMRNLVQAGGRYVLIYDNQPGPVFDLEIRLDGITGGGSVSSEIGSMLLSLLKEDSEVRLRLDANLTLPPIVIWRTNQQTAGKASTFNTWGPSGEGYTVTSLLGPGGRVLSTIPRKVGGWGLQSGTSMAVPYVIGCIALLKEAFPNTDSRTIAETLLHTAEPVNFNDGTNTTYDFLASVWQQGAGRVQAYNAFKALQSRIRISGTSLHFNDTEFSHKTLSFKITNAAHEAFGYSILSRPAVTVLSLPNTHHRPVPMTPALKVAEADTQFLDTLRPLEHAAITISVVESGTNLGATKPSQDTSDLSLAVGQSVTIIITTDTSSLEKFGDLCPLYSGFVDIRGASGLVQSVSYAGIACQVRSLHNLVPDQNTTFLAAATREDAYMARHEGFQLKKAPTGTIFTLPRAQDPKDRKAYTSLVLPTIQVDLSMYSRVIRFDIFPAEDEHHSSLLFTTDVSHRIGGYGRIETHFFHWTGSLPNGSWAYPGEYRIRVSPLRLYGDADSTNDFQDIFTTDAFAINYSGLGFDSASLKPGHYSSAPCLEESIGLI